jgi:membrane-associated phospholipid phosphatase
VTLRSTTCHAGPGRAFADAVASSPRPRRLLAADPHAPSRQHTLVLAGAGAASVALLATLVARLDVDEQWAIDHRMRTAFRARRSPRTRRALDAAGRIGTVAVYGPVTVLALASVARERGLRRSMPIAAAVGGAVVLGFALKQLVRRPRPTSENGPANSHPSFPSGHASRATALAAMLGYVAVRERVGSPMVATALATAVAVATGVSRAYADAHWTTDVIGGWATGISAMAAAALLYEHVRAGEHA